MRSDRMRRRIDRILDQIEDAADHLDRATVRQGAKDVLIFDPETADALNFLAVAQQGLDGGLGAQVSSDVSPGSIVPDKGTPPATTEW